MILRAGPDGSPAVRIRHPAPTATTALLRRGYLCKTTCATVAWSGTRGDKPTLAHPGQQPKSPGRAPHSRSASCATLSGTDKTPRWEPAAPCSAGRRREAHRVIPHIGRPGTSPEPPEHPNPTHHTFRPGQTHCFAPRKTTSIESFQVAPTVRPGSRRKSLPGTELDDTCVPGSPDQHIERQVGARVAWGLRHGVHRCRTQPTPSRGTTDSPPRCPRSEPSAILNRAGRAAGLAALAPRSLNAGAQRPGERESIAPSERWRHPAGSYRPHRSHSGQTAYRGGQSPTRSSRRPSPAPPGVGEEPR
jgi:hypothetical protein